MKHNKNGFTLVELLAVIIILAILVLLAMPRVINMMESARVNSFVVEANEIVKVAQTAYNDGLVDGEDAEVTVCYTVDELIKKGYLDKAEGDIRGVVVLDTASETNDIKIYSYLSKQGYYIKNLSGTSKMTKDDVISNDGSLIYNDCTSSCTATAGGVSIKCGDNEISTRTSGTDVPSIPDEPTEVCEIENEIVTFSYTGNIQTFTAPCSGTYKLEVWGAQGRKGEGYTPGYGGYAVGTATLSKTTTLYVVVGGQGGGTGAYGSSPGQGGYNGGGVSPNVKYGGYSGGGATHVATTNRGVLSNYNSYRSEVLIVAGGGGASHQYYGGNGGGFKGNNATNWDNVVINGGSQTSGFAFGQGAYTSGSPDDYDGGGGGWFGGYGSGLRGGAGGSGYLNTSVLTDAHMTCLSCATSDDTATKTISNSCSNATATADCAKTGNGYAKITYLGE